MRRDCFIETAQVSTLRDAVKDALDAGVGYPAIVMVYGEAGAGKTRAARTLYAEFGGIYVRALEGMSQASFLGTLSFEVTGARPQSAARCRSDVIDALGEEPTPLFVDEADRLHIGRLEDLRDIHDLTGSPVVLIGELGLPTRVSTRSRINDRIPASFRVEFGAIKRSDVMLYAQKAADLTLTPEAAGLVETQTKGIFRRVHNAVLLLEQAARARGVATISVDLARAAFDAVKSRGA